MLKKWGKCENEKKSKNKGNSWKATLYKINKTHYKPNKFYYWE